MFLSLQALDPGQAQDIERFSLRIGHSLGSSHGSSEYLLGSESLLLIKSKQVGLSFSILKSELLEDGRSIRLTIEDWQPAHMLELNVDVTTRAGQPIRTQIHHTACHSRKRERPLIGLGFAWGVFLDG